MLMSPKVVVDPFTRILYASYYLDGFLQVFGKNSIVFDSTPFKAIESRSQRDFDHFFLCIIELADHTIKCVIDFHDSPEINPTVLAWCDVYGKVNYNCDVFPDTTHQSKITPIAPGFSVKTPLFTGIIGFLHFTNNYFKIKKEHRPGIKRFFAGYFSRRRLTLREYNPHFSVNDNYIFFISTLWKHEFCVTHTNPWRLSFIENIHEHFPSIQFEGGFVIHHAAGENYLRYKALKRYALNDYLLKINQSFLVFNTPAVHNCHGWKLPEYLLLGKAIISTPITNKLPAPLTHGENVHFISTPDEIPAAIDLIKNNVAYRNKLACGAREYYRTYVSPESAVDAIVFHYLKEKNGI